MNKNILKTGPQEFIEKNWNTDSLSVLLQKPFFSGVSQKELVMQLEAKKKCRTKLPTWFKTNAIYYPPKLHIEQSSSEQTAAYKAELVHGKTLLDMTGGFGVDSFYFAKKVPKVFHCELNPELSAIACHNFEVLGAGNIRCHVEDGITFLQNSKEGFDWIYLDPSRRDTTQRVFLLKDCEPNILSHLKTIFSKANRILIKTAPLLDIKQGLRELGCVKEVHIVAVQNEVKELLWVLENGHTDEAELKTINLTKKTDQRFNFHFSKEEAAISKIVLPQDYLYEPNAAILKSGAFKLLGRRFDLGKLHEHSHLYTSHELIDFPGRRFSIENVVPYSKTGLLQLGLTKANITTRNFPQSVSSLRKRTKLKEGGDDYLFFTTNLNEERIVLHCKRKP
ncbi:class I SAM-dependent methyltransferase [Muricauda sp. SCSIO 64092]|nr:class I SAM-dependent methyltransferase [Muricauda sp. SCSIO 64092]